MPYRATRLISSSDAGFSNAEMSPSFCQERGTRDVAHHSGVSRFWYVADENHFTRRECFARLDGERVF